MWDRRYPRPTSTPSIRGHRPAARFDGEWETLKRRDLQLRETRGRPEHSQGGTEGHSDTEVLIEALASWALVLSPKSGPHERQERRMYLPTKHLMPLTAGFQIEGAEKQVSLCLAQSQRLPEAESR